MLEKHQNIAKKFKELVSKKVKVHELIVYRSEECKEAIGYSNLELLIVVDELNREIEEHISDCAWEVELSEDACLLTFPTSKSEFENGHNNSPWPIKNIYSNGIRI
ncbi:MAG: hypothetical protein FVQ77_07965 [Cytophagales bacterium]|nr:hypothetical protein [Cytophagales bacterium]